MGLQIYCTNSGGFRGIILKFIETKSKGAYIIELEPIIDNRGSFIRSFCKKEFERIGLNYEIVQSNISYNQKAGTLRGMHFQKMPYEETKIVSCLKGAIYDVIIDIRPDSETYLDWMAIELSEENHKMLYIPKGFAHGFQTLADDTIINYQMGEFYNPDSSGGIRWNDPQFNIKWPVENKIISDKDLSYEDFN